MYARGGDVKSYYYIMFKWFEDFFLSPTFEGDGLDPFTQSDKLQQRSQIRKNERHLSYIIAEIYQHARLNIADEQFEHPEIKSLLRNTLVTQYKCDFLEIHQVRWIHDGNPIMEYIGHSENRERGYRSLSSYKWFNGYIFQFAENMMNRIIVDIYHACQQQGLHFYNPTNHAEDDFDNDNNNNVMNGDSKHIEVGPINGQKKQFNSDAFSKIPTTNFASGDAVIKHLYSNIKHLMDSRIEIPRVIDFYHNMIEISVSFGQYEYPIPCCLIFGKHYFKSQLQQFPVKLRVETEYGDCYLYDKRNIQVVIASMIGLCQTLNLSIQKNEDAEHIDYENEHVISTHTTNGVIGRNGERKRSHK